MFLLLLYFFGCFSLRFFFSTTDAGTGFSTAAVFFPFFEGVVAGSGAGAVLAAFGFRIVFLIGVSLAGAFSTGVFALVFGTKGVGT